MRFLCFVGGQPFNNGLDTATAGEGRWAASLAKVFSLKGHSIHVVNGASHQRPEWGNARIYPNVTLSHTWDPNQQFDFCIYTPWENLDIGGPGHYGACTTLPIKAHHYLHCQFGWGESVESDHKCYLNNHHVVYPYIQDAAQWPKDRNFRYFPLPIAGYESFSPKNTEKRTNIIWSSKAVFHPEWPDDHYILRLGTDTLKALKRLQKDFDFNLYFLDSLYINHPKRMGDLSLLNEIKNVHQIKTLLPRDKLIEVMNTCRVGIVLGGMMGSFMENISSGCIPLCFQGHIYRDSAEKQGLKLDYLTATEDDLYNCMYRLFSSNEFHEQTIDMYQHELRYYSVDSVYDYFLSLCKELNYEIVR